MTITRMIATVQATMIPASFFVFVLSSFQMPKTCPAVLSHNLTVETSIEPIIKIQRDSVNHHQLVSICA